MNPLSLVYGAVIHLRNMVYDTGFFSAELRGPVISVGSISAGGAGKTPLVLLLGEALKQRGISFDVLSRGYGRKSKGVLLVDPAGSAADFGDEPLLIARRLGVPVVVGENRYHAGLLAERQFGPRMHLLDDGFQHRALARDFDIVLLTAAESDDRLLPAGRLREPATSLTRGDAIVFSLHVETQQPKPGHYVVTKPVLDSSARCWRLQRRTVLPASLPGKAIAFCGIARPHNFFADLTDAGLRPEDKVIFPDHHSYTQRDIERLLELRESKAANGFISTEKDAINLGSHAAALQPLAIAKVELDLQDGDRVISDMLQTVSERHRARS